MTDLNKGELLSSWQPHSSTTVVQLCITADETSVWSLGKDGTLVHSSLLSEHSRSRLNVKEVEMIFFIPGCGRQSLKLGLRLLLLFALLRIQITFSLAPRMVLLFARSNLILSLASSIGFIDGSLNIKVEEGSQSKYEEVLAVGSLPWPAVRSITFLACV